MSFPAVEQQYQQQMPEKQELNYSYYDSIKFYLGWKDPSYYEDKLLSYLPFYPNESETKSAERIDTPIDSSGNFIHEFAVYNKLPSTTEEPLDIVLIHGYGAALGFFYKNLDGLSDINGSTLHAIDMNGFGLSGRPSFPNLKGDTIDDVRRSEDFFIDAFEKWRINKGLKKFVLIAHSLGGYLCCCYYLKFGKGIVTKLILLSPVGVEDSDFSLLNGDTNDISPSSLNIEETIEIVQSEGVDVMKELNDHQNKEPHKIEFNPVVSEDDDLSIISNDNDDPDISKSIRLEQSRRLQITNKWFIRLWENNYSPFQVLRYIAPISTKFFSKWTFNRFGKVEKEDELIDILNYTSRIFLAKGSGEFGLTRLLAPGAIAKLPLIKRIPNEINVKSLWLYGDVDWMNKSAGYLICKKINANGDISNKAKFRIIPDAGHHMYIDNAAHFEKQVMKFIREE